ncbi:ATP dependent DNA ligase [Ephemerocybe angulata]|uniref:ATP dependent DNA ligase n=1 Tax=Ephemerocybe angulata TaxID=980116 RepID=A0A8H6HL87_9AGAR|nr:ATP dependent DNA ligase [Tulosesus angulatus]
MASSLVLTRNRGTLALIGDHITELVQDALKSAFFGSNGLTAPPFDTSATYHVTVLSKAELRSVPKEQVLKITTKVDPLQIHCIGIGGNKDAGVLYLIVVWAAGQQIRKQLGLPPKHFHITLSSNDSHDMDKSVDSLFPDQFPEKPSLELLDHLAFTSHAFFKYTQAEAYGIDLILHFPQSQKGFLRLADAAFAIGTFKLAMLSYACIYDRTDDGKLHSYCLKKLASCSAHTEWGHVFQEHEIPQIPNAVAPLLVTPWSPSLRSSLADAGLTPSLQLEPRGALYIPKSPIEGRFDKSVLYKLPRFFRWLIPFRFAIMSTPRHEEDIAALSSSWLGVRRVLTLTKEEPLDPAWFRGRSIHNTFLPIPNYHPPSIEGMDIVMRLFMDDSNLPLLVHCGGGKGRAGTVAACYMAACGFNAPSYDQTQPELSAQEAVSLIRSLRPGSIETTQQEEFVSKWCSTIWKRQAIFPSLPSEPAPCPMVTEGTLSKAADLFMFVGLAGSGKTWVSKSLLARDPGNMTHISQDDSGSRALCETAIGRIGQGKKAILDRCNVTASDRKIWLDLASNWCTYPICVWFDYDRELCQSRAQRRADHPTLPPGSRVKNSIDQMAKLFERPSLKEGFKAIVVIRSFEAAQEFVAWASPPVGVYKFPRTPHLLDLGAATEDDIRTDASSLSTLRGHIVITEKIDGANMGFSLSSDGTQIVVQNRSHYVNTSSHEQFKKLGLWIERHKEELIMLLNRDPYFPERYILFGEWMYATHSIPYTQLPDYFIAYDFFDRAKQRWMDTKTLKNMLSGTTIFSVPVLAEGGPVPSDDDLRAMVQKSSAFYDGRVEGVYVKIERDASVVYRAKVVRSDFIAGNEHWTRGGVHPNGLAIDT